MGEELKSTGKIWVSLLEELPTPIDSADLEGGCEERGHLPMSGERFSVPLVYNNTTALPPMAC